MKSRVVLLFIMLGIALIGAVMPPKVAEAMLIVGALGAFFSWVSILYYVLPRYRKRPR
jgi:hypothetical protein